MTGCSAALWLAEQHQDVILLEARPTPRPHLDSNHTWVHIRRVPYPVVPLGGMVDFVGPVAIRVSRHNPNSNHDPHPDSDPNANHARNG